MSDWNPEDGAGYIPTEEGGSSRDKVAVWNHSSVRVQDSAGMMHTVLACKLTDDDVNGDGTVSMPPSGECDCFEAMEPFKADIEDIDVTRHSEIRALVDRLEEEAQEVADREENDLNRNRDYESGVCAGIRYAKDELEGLIDE